MADHRETRADVRKPFASNGEEASDAATTILAESGRVEAFSDGVFAIAITLLALDLKAANGGPGTVMHTLLDQWPAYLAYLASFLYIGVIWVNHHALFTRISKVDGGLLYRNLLLLLPASILPFPTATLANALQHGNYEDQRAAVTLYGLTSIFMAITWLLIFSYLDRHPHLLQPNVPAGFFKEERRRAMLGIISPIVGNAIGFVIPGAALIIYLLLVIFYALTTEGLISRKPRL